MDQLIKFETIIEGKIEEVIEGAMAAGRRFSLNSFNFDDDKYHLDKSLNKEERIKKLKSAFGYCAFEKYNDDNMALFRDCKEYWGCIDEKKILEVADVIKEVSLGLEMHINTIVFKEGINLHIEVDYKNGKTVLNSFEEYFRFDDSEDYREEDVL